VAVAMLTEVRDGKEGATMRKRAESGMALPTGTATLARSSFPAAVWTATYYINTVNLSFSHSNASYIAVNCFECEVASRGLCYSEGLPGVSSIAVGYKW
jgi:hypothetical protein